MSGSVRVTIDADVCIGGGQCEMLEAETFLVDDDTAIASVIGTGLLAPVNAAMVVDRCPSGAISIVADDPTSPADRAEA